MSIKIESTTGLTSGVVVTDDCGHELKNIVAIQFERMTPHQTISATLEFTPVEMSIVAEPYVSRETLGQLAAQHGFELVHAKKSTLSKYINDVEKLDKRHLGMYLTGKGGEK